MLANIITIGNAMCGIGAILFGLKGDFVISGILIFVGTILDFLDGRIARKLHQTSIFGAQLDSFSDLTTFIITPAILFFVRYLDFQRYTILTILFFVGCGIWRLARFNTKDIEKKINPDKKTSKKGFSGLPTTASGILLAIILIFFPSLPQIIVIGLLLLLGVLMVSTIKIKKI